MAIPDQHDRPGGTVFDSSGRSGPARAVVATIAAAAILWVGGIAFDRGGMAAWVLGGGIVGLTLAWLFAEWARRLHDGGTSGWTGAAIGAVAVVVVMVLTVSPLRDGAPWILPAAGIAIGIIVAGVLLRPGTRGDNRYGPPPPGTFAIGGGRSGGGLRWAAVAALGGALTGYALIDISDGMRDAQQRTRQTIEQGDAR